MDWPNSNGWSLSARQIQQHFSANSYLRANKYRYNMFLFWKTQFRFQSKNFEVIPMNFLNLWYTLGLTVKGTWATKNFNSLQAYIQVIKRVLEMCTEKDTVLMLSIVNSWKWNFSGTSLISSLHKSMAGNERMLNFMFSDFISGRGYFLWKFYFRNKVTVHVWRLKFV